MAAEHDEHDVPATPGDAIGEPASLAGVRDDRNDDAGPRNDAEPSPPADHEEPEFQLPVITRWDMLCVAPIMLYNLWVIFGRVISPNLLLHHTVLLEFLRGSIPAMITAGAEVKVGQVPLWIAVIAPITYLMFSDPFIYWAGRRYGHVALEYLTGNQPKMRRRIAFAERFFARWGAWTILFSYFIPASPIFFLAAGDVGMPFLLFIVADLMGTLIFIGLMLSLGYVFPNEALNIAQSITHWAWYLTAVLVILVLIPIFRGGSPMPTMPTRQSVRKQ